MTTINLETNQKTNHNEGIIMTAQQKEIEPKTNTFSKDVYLKIKKAWSENCQESKVHIYKNALGHRVRDKSKCLEFSDHMIYLLLLNKDLSKSVQALAKPGTEKASCMQGRIHSAIRSEQFTLRRLKGLFDLDDEMNQELFKEIQKNAQQWIK